MYPGMMHWWKRVRSQAGCGTWACGGASGDEQSQERSCGPGDFGGVFGGGPFGVRRPLRFLAYKLDLSEQQVADLAQILDELKTERAQAEVDRRRKLSAFADAVAATAFDEARATEGASLEGTSSDRLREAVLKALRRIHAILKDEQRAKLAYLIRSGAVSL